MLKKLSIGLLLLVVSVLFPSPAQATTGDFYATGTRWCASTYDGHPTIPGYGPAIDLNADAGDDHRSMYAPGDGNVSVYSTGYGDGWGNSIIWTSADGSESIHAAHLDEIVATGAVAGGDLIGYAGATGNVDPQGEGGGAHIHAARKANGSPAQLALSGQAIVAGQCYVSAGQTGSARGDSGDDELLLYRASDGYRNMLNVTTDGTRRIWDVEAWPKGLSSTTAIDVDGS